MTSRCRGSSAVSLMFFSVGLGIVMGYALFLNLWRTECANILQESKNRQEIIFQRVQREYDAVKSELGQCQLDESKLEVYRELEGYTMLIGRHQELLDKYDQRLGRIRTLERELAESNGRIHSLKDQIKRLQNQLSTTTIENQRKRIDAEKKEQRILLQLQVARSLLKQKIELNSRSNAQSLYHEMTLVQNEDLLRALKNQSLIQTQLKYGRGPYKVEMELASVDGQCPSLPSIVQIELNNLDDMPHTTESVLTMMHEGIYVGTSFTFVQTSNSFVGGQSNGDNDDDQAEIFQQAIRHHFHRDVPLLFHESALMCDEYGFGMDGKGPGFFVVLSPKAESNNSCVGRVVQGLELLQRMQAKSYQQEYIIVATRIVPIPKEKL